MMKLIKASMLLFGSSFLSISPGSVFGQQAIDTPICYVRTANGSIVDLTILCKQNREERSPSAVQNIGSSTSDIEKLNTLSQEMYQVCEQRPTQCHDRSELINQLRRICSTPNHCPNYINENLQRTRSSNFTHTISEIPHQIQLSDNYS